MCKNEKNCDCDENVDEFMGEFHEHGLECGEKIANIAKELHHNALVIVPLYRSCIVIEQSDKEKADGACTMHSYADPHWLGRDIDIETLKSSEFHFELLIKGDRQGAIIQEDEDKIIIENDEN